MECTANASPFIKWAGGKRKLMEQLAPYFPDRIPTYWEPFAGGGAAYFAMAERIGNAFLSDANEELVTTYNVVKNTVDGLIKALRKHERNHYADPDYYYTVRASSPRTDMSIASRFIYLNKTGFNGLYRVNKNGKFNVPKGKYVNPNICDEERLRTASRALANVTIKNDDFNRVDISNKIDFIYCDPPYDETFTAYQAGGFDRDDQKRLCDYAKKWSKGGGAKVVVSNSDTPFIREIYKDEFNIYQIKAARNINRDPNGRGPVSEIVAVSK